MKIQTINTNNKYSFQARRKEIRKADDIVRKVNQEFPAFSPTYAYEFWPHLKTIPEGYGDIRTINSEEKVRKYRKEIDQNKNYDTLLETIKEQKVANCGEKSYLTVAALLANGYDKFTKRFNVGIKWAVTDKRTGEKVFEHIEDFDHSIIVTTMTNEEPARLNDLIVIDGWLNKAMSFSEAHATYEAMLKEDFLTETYEKSVLKFIKKNTKDYGLLGKKLPPDFDINNYKFKHNIVFYKPQDTRYPIKGNDFDKLTNKVKEKYPNLVFEENKNI